VNEGTSLRDSQRKTMKFLDRMSLCNPQRRREREYLYNCLRQSDISYIAFRPRLNQKKAFCVFEIHSFDIHVRLFCGVMAKLSVTCCNKNISKYARRKELLQFEVNIVRVVEDEKPSVIGLARKPTQAGIHGSLGISWCNGLEIRLKGLLARGVNVEDLRETIKHYIVSKPHSDFIGPVDLPFALGFFNEFKCKLALS